MLIFDALKQDHDEVKELLAKAAETGGQKTRQRLFEKIRKALLAHAMAEQQTFYRALLDHEETADETMEAEVEHEIVTRLLEDMGATEDPERWQAKCTVLKELVEHHIKEEEKEIFKAARKVLDKQQQQELAEEFLAAKKEQMVPAA